MPVSDYDPDEDGDDDEHKDEDEDPVRGREAILARVRERAGDEPVEVEEARDQDEEGERGVDDLLRESPEEGEKPECDRGGEGGGCDESPDQLRKELARVRVWEQEWLGLWWRREKMPRAKVERERRRKRRRAGRSRRRREEEGTKEIGGG